MANHWLTHVKKTMKTMKARGTYKKGQGLKQVIKEAKKTYKKGKRGGADEEEERVAFPPMQVRKGARRTRRHSRR